MIVPSTSRRLLLLGLLLALAAVAVRLPHLDWGLPQVEEEALPMKKALDLWGWNEGHLQLDPKTAGWPALSFYLHLGWQHLQYGVGRLQGIYHDRYDFLVDNSVDPRPILLWARMLGVLASAGVVLLATIWGGRLSHTLTGGFLSGAILVVSPLLIRQAQRVTPDILMAWLAALAVVAILSVSQRGRRRDDLLAGMAIGLGTACKYTPILFWPSLYLVHLQRRRREGRSLRWGGLDDRRLGVATAAMVAAFVVASPYTLVHLGVLRRDLSYQLLHMTRGHFGQTGPPVGLGYYLGEVLGPGLGWPALVLAGAGAVLAAWRLRGPWIALVACILPFLVGISLLSTRFPRYALPLLLPLALGLAAWPALLRERLTATGGRLGRPLASLALALVGLVVLLPAVEGALRTHRNAGKIDTLNQARAWMFDELLPDDPALAMEAYTPQVPTDRQELAREQPFFARLSASQRAKLMDRPRFRADPIPMNAVRVELIDYYYDLRQYLPYDYVVTSSSVRGRYEAEPDRFPRQIRFYADLERYGRRIRTFSPSAEHPGPEIRFYALPPEGKARLLEERGELPEDEYRRFLDRLHAPQFFSFLENQAYRAEEAGQWRRTVRALRILQRRSDLSPEQRRRLQRRIQQDEDRLTPTSPPGPSSSGNAGGGKIRGES